MNDYYLKQRRCAGRITAIVLAMLMILTSLQMPVNAETSTSVRWVTNEITTETTSVEVVIDGDSLPSTGFMRIFELDEGAAFDSSNFFSYKTLATVGIGDLKLGESITAVLDTNTALTEGSQVIAVLRDFSGDEAVDYCTDPITVTAPVKDDPGDDPATDPDGEPAISITGEITTSSKEIPISISGKLPEGAVVSVRGYASSHTDIDYSNAWAGNGDYNFNIGTLIDAGPDSTSVAVSGGEYLTQGTQIVAYVLDSGSPVAHSDIVIVKGSGSLADRAERILQNCSVKLLSEGDIGLDTTEIGVRVGLDDEVESCTLTIYELPQNIAYDSDTASYFTSLWSGTVSDGYEETIAFREAQLPLKPYHKLVAVLNVPIDTSGDGYYRTKDSDAVYILDENGERFRDYDYPDIRIDEKTLEAGATSLHLTLEGDERLFEAAKDPDKDFQIVYSVGMYPDGESFDFEGSNQTGLLNYQTATEAFSGKEITFDTPLKEGYRVRAVVYWSQNEELFIAKGNDYEEMFHMPDDSVLVSAASNDPKVSLPEDIYEGDTSLEVALSGNIPEGSMLLIKSFDKDAAEYASDKGAAHGVTFNVGSGKVTAELKDADTISAGQRLVAFLMNSGEVIAASEPAVVKVVPAPTLSIQGKLTAGTSDVSVVIEGKVPEDAKLFLFRFDENAASYARSDGQYLANMNSGVKAGTNTFSNVTLTAGTKVAAFLLDGSYDDVASSDPVTVIDPESELAVSAGAVRTDSKTVNVDITGSVPDGAILLVKSYDKDVTDFAIDSGEAHGVTSGIAAGTVSHELTNTDNIKAGRKLVAFILSGGNPVAQSDPVVIEQGAYEAPSVSILDKELTAGDVKLHFSTSFDKAIDTASYEVLVCTGDAFDAESAKAVLSGKVSSSGETTVYIGEKVKNSEITVGDKLAVALTAAGETVYSEPITMEASPEWGGAEAVFKVDTIADDASSIPVNVNYSNEYINKYGDDFYCDVTVYMFDSAIDDDMFEEEELWEKSGEAVAVAKDNSRRGDETRGDIEIPLLQNASLEAGRKLIIKVRLPHTEWVDDWDDEEEDFVSSSIMIRPASEFAYGPSVLLYNVDFDTNRGKTIKSLLEDNGILYKTVTKEDFGQTIGYLLEEKGFEESSEPYDGNSDYESEWMLMHASDQDRWMSIFLDDGGFIDKMRENGVAIDYKAASTPTNKSWTLGKLIGDIVEEHETMSAWISLNKVVEAAEALDEETYKDSVNWDDFKAALDNAKAALSTGEEEGLSPELLSEANGKLSDEMRKLTADAETTAGLTEKLRTAVADTDSISEEVYGNSVNWKAYQEALKEAKDILENGGSNAGAIELALNKLEREADQLTAGTSKTEEFKAGLNELIGKESEYPEKEYGSIEGWKEYTEALANAKAVMAEENPSTTRIEKAKLRLEKAEAELAAAYKAATDKAAKEKAAADKAAKEKAAAAKAAKEKAAAEAKAKKVKTVTVNAATVNAKAIDKAVAAKGGSNKYVTKIVLGKKVRKISPNAFARYSKVKTLELKTKKLTKKAVKKSLKKSRIKTIRVKAGSKSVNKKLVKKYKKFFTKKNAGKKVTVR